MDPLLPSFRRELRARAHVLHPVVAIGQHGLTPPVLHEIDVALNAHELVKIRVFNDDRDEREALLARIVDALHCASVQTIGKLLVVWRPRPPDEKAKPVQATNAGRRRAADAQQPPARDRRRRIASPPSSAGGARARRTDTDSLTVPPTRNRKPGKAPAGVPRAAAPRRRRRAP